MYAGKVGCTTIYTTFNKSGANIVDDIDDRTIKQFKFAIYYIPLNLSMYVSAQGWIYLL